jgi:hypothetical protein
MCALLGGASPEERGYSLLFAGSLCDGIGAGMAASNVFAAGDCLGFFGVLTCLSPSMETATGAGSGIREEIPAPLALAGEIGMR